MFDFNDPTLNGLASQVAAKPVVAGMGDDAWLAASAALATNAVLDTPGMLRPFLAWQAAAFAHVEMILGRWQGALLADDMGLGKTQVAQAIAAKAALNGKPVLVIAPPVAQGGWQSDLRAAFPGVRMHVIKGRKVDVAALPQADIYWMSDDSLTMKAWLCDVTKDDKGHEVFHASAFAQSMGMLIRDEIHRDKGNQGKPTGRAKVMLAVSAALRGMGRKVLGMTGTLLTNRPVEAYIPLQIVGGDDVLTALTPGAHRGSAFLWRYCAPTKGFAAGGRQFTSFNNIDTEQAKLLHEYLRRTVYVRREKSDLGEGVLPHSSWLIVPLALDSASMAKVKKAEKEFLAYIQESKGVEAMWRVEKGRMQAMQQMMALWQECGVAKSQAAVEYVKDLVEAGEQVVAFYHHDRTLTAMMTGLAKAGIGYSVINGSVTGDARTDTIEEFQAGDTPVVLAQIKAAGMSVTLTAAAHAVFVQCPWSAGDLKQAADRILRVDDITRDRAAAGGRITWHVLQACYYDGDPTFDAAIWKVLETKAEVCDAVNAGRPITMPEESVYLEAMRAWVPSAKHHAW